MSNSQPRYKICRVSACPYVNRKKRLNWFVSALEVLGRIDLIIGRFGFPSVKFRYFLKFNYIVDKNKINFEENILINFKKFLNLYKKEKNPIYQDLLIFLSDYYIEIRKKEDPSNYLEIIENRSFLIKSINDFFLYNLNQGTLMNSIERRFGDD